MGILGIIIHAALGIGGICSGIQHGKALYDGVKTNLNNKKEEENQEKTEETNE